MYGQHHVTSRNANGNGWKGCQKLCLGCKRMLKQGQIKTTNNKDKRIGIVQLVLPSRTIKVNKSKFTFQIAPLLGYLYIYIYIYISCMSLAQMISDDCAFRIKTRFSF